MTTAGDGLDRLAWLAALVGVGEDIELLGEDEHRRYALYLAAMDTIAPEEQHDLLVAIRADPDEVMADSALLEFLERQWNDLGPATFRDWIARNIVIFQESTVTSTRLSEWLAFYEVVTSGDTNLPVADMSDWLQRRLSTETTSNSVLSRLATEGRTKRVRRAAELRLQADERA